MQQQAPKQAYQADRPVRPVFQREEVVEDRPSRKDREAEARILEK